MVAMTDRAAQMPRAIAEMCERLAGDIIQSTEADSVTKMLGLEHMDVVAAGVQGAVKAWPKFDPSRNIQPQTFLYRPIHSAIFDYLRKEGSATRRVVDFANGGKIKADKARDLVDWLNDVYEAAKRVYVASRFRQGRRAHSAPQLVALARLMEHEKLSCRGCAKLLATREDLRDVLKLKRLPYYSTLSRAASLLKVATGTTENTAEVATVNN